MSSEKRPYQQRARAERQAATRERIAAATLSLHEEVGPARTTVAEIARRAGVQRLTVYNNFPTQSDLLEACQRHLLAERPPPDFAAILAAAKPEGRLEAALAALYAWYRTTGPLTANVQRDRAALPELDALLAATSDAELARLRNALAAALHPEPPAPLRAAVALALD